MCVCVCVCVYTSINSGRIYMRLYTQTTDRKSVLLSHLNEINKKGLFDNI